MYCFIIQYCFLVLFQTQLNDIAQCTLPRRIPIRKTVQRNKRWVQQHQSNKHRTQQHQMHIRLESSIFGEKINLTRLEKYIYMRKLLTD